MYTLDDALGLARNLIHGPITPEDTPISSIPEAIAAVDRAISTCDFNWLTGQEARRVLREAAKKKPIGLLACCSRKLPHAAPAKNLYCSALFKKQRAYIETVCSEWAILSAKHRFVLPDQVIEPYDQTLHGMKARDRERWGFIACNMLRAHWPDWSERQFIVLAGADYRTGVLCCLNCTFPLDGMEIGEQLHWLTEQLKTNEDHLLW
ncbi:MAG: DUF6884 domain-containing protein [Bacillota bacterium]